LAITPALVDLAGDPVQATVGLVDVGKDRVAFVMVQVVTVVPGAKFAAGRVVDDLGQRCLSFVAGIDDLADPVAQLDFGDEHGVIGNIPMQVADRLPHRVGPPLPDPVDDQLGRHGLGDAVALGVIAVQLEQQAAVFDGFDTFGDDFALEGAG